MQAVHSWLPFGRVSIYATVFHSIMLWMFNKAWVFANWSCVQSGHIVRPSNTSWMGNTRVCTDIMLFFCNIFYIIFVMLWFLPMLLWKLWSIFSWNWTYFHVYSEIFNVNHLFSAICNLSCLHQQKQSIFVPIIQTFHSQAL